MNLSELISMFREQNMKYIPPPPPKPKTRPETDEEFQYRAFHTPFYCEKCGSPVYPEWVPTMFNQKDGTPYLWENVQPCPKCGKVDDETMRQDFGFGRGNFCWNGFFRIYKKEIPIEDQIQTDESGV